MNLKNLTSNSDFVLILEFNDDNKYKDKSYKEELDTLNTEPQDSFLKQDTDQQLHGLNKKVNELKKDMICIEFDVLRIKNEIKTFDKEISELNRFINNNNYSHTDPNYIAKRNKAKTELMDVEQRISESKKKLNDKYMELSIKKKDHKNILRQIERSKNNKKSEDIKNEPVFDKNKNYKKLIAWEPGDIRTDAGYVNTSASQDESFESKNNVPVSDIINNKLSDKTINNINNLHVLFDKKEKFIIDNEIFKYMNAPSQIGIEHIAIKGANRDMEELKKIIKELNTADEAGAVNLIKRAGAILERLDEAVLLAKKYEGFKSYDKDGNTIADELSEYKYVGGLGNNCADFVSAILIKLGRIDKNKVKGKNPDYVPNLADYFGKKDKNGINPNGYIEVKPENIKPGDICILGDNSHIEIVTEKITDQNGRVRNLIGSNNNGNDTQEITLGSAYTDAKYYRKIN